MVFQTLSKRLDWTAYPRLFFSSFIGGKHAPAEGSVCKREIAGTAASRYPTQERLSQPTWYVFSIDTDMCDGIGCVCSIGWVIQRLSFVMEWTGIIGIYHFHNK